MIALVLFATLWSGGWTLQRVATCSSSDPIMTDIVYGNVPWYECKQTWELVPIHHRAKPCVNTHHHHCHLPSHPRPLSKLRELVGGEVEVDHDGAVLAQGVLDDVDGLEVGVGAAEHLVHQLVGVEAADAADPLLRGGVDEDDVIAERHLLNRDLDSMGHGRRIGESAGGSKSIVVDGKLSTRGCGL